MIELHEGPDTDFDYTGMTKAIYDKIMAVAPQAIVKKNFMNSKHTFVGKGIRMYYLHSPKSDDETEPQSRLIVFNVTNRGKHVNVIFTIPRDPAVAKDRRTSAYFSGSGAFGINHPVAYVFINPNSITPEGVLAEIQNKLIGRVVNHELNHYTNFLKLGKEIYNKKVLANIGKAAAGNMYDYVNFPEEVNARYMELVYRVLNDVAKSKRRTKDLYPSFNDMWSHYYRLQRMPRFLYRWATEDTKKRLQKRLYKLYDYIKDDVIDLNRNAIQKIINTHTQDTQNGLKYIGFGRFVNKDNKVTFMKKDGKLIPFKGLAEGAKEDIDSRAEARRLYRMARNFILDTIKENPERFTNTVKSNLSDQLATKEIEFGNKKTEEMKLDYIATIEPAEGYPPSRILRVRIPVGFKPDTMDRVVGFDQNGNEIMGKRTNIDYIQIAFCVPEDPVIQSKMVRAGVYAYRNYITSDPISCVFGKLRGWDADEWEYFVDDAGTKSTAIHELTHNLDHKRFGYDKWEKAMGNYILPDKDFSGYINHPVETNARYMEWVEEILVDLANMDARQKKQYPDSVLDFSKKYPTFKSFMDTYGTAYFVPMNLYKYWTPETKQRLYKRVYRLYDYLKNGDVQWDDSDAIRKIMINHQDQISDDPEKNKIAGQMGLKYIGFGRFVNKDNEVVYIKKDGKLKPFRSVLDMRKFLRKK